MSTRLALAALCCCATLASTARGAEAPGAFASATPPQELAPFLLVPRDKPPPEITRGFHYWASNEDRLDLFFPALNGRAEGGLQMGVGTEQNYLFAGWARPKALVLLDFDDTVPTVHRLWWLAFALADTPQAVVELWSPRGVVKLRAALKEQVPAGRARDVMLNILSRAQPIVFARLNKVVKQFSGSAAGSFVTDAAQYAAVRALVLEGRVFSVRGDLTAKETVRIVGEAARQSQLPLRVLYLSNAEQYFPYDEDFRMNIKSLPFDAQGIVVRTNGYASFGYAKNGNAYHYLVQDGVGMQAWLGDSRTVDVKTLVRAGIAQTRARAGATVEPVFPTVPNEKGFSVLVGPPPAHAVQRAAITARAQQQATATPPDALACQAKVPAGMSCIPGGAFLRGTDDIREWSSTPQASVWLQTFYMDQREVTVADYRACMRRGACAKAGPTYADFSAPEQPIHGVNWFHAKAYCQAQGKTLPTEAQWEKAARGTDGRTYPWGNDAPTCDRAVFEDVRGRSCGVRQRSATNAHVGRPEPTGTRPANPYGLFDMAGNAFEWVADWYAPSWTACGAACVGVDPLGPCDGKTPCPGHHDRVVRGGSWFWPQAFLTTTMRRPHTPQNVPFHHFGFRCAATAEQARALAAQ